MHTHALYIHRIVDQSLLTIFMNVVALLLFTTQQGADEIEIARIQLAEMSWEYEVAACREHLAEQRLKDLQKLQGVAEVSIRM